VGLLVVLPVWVCGCVVGGVVGVGVGLLLVVLPAWVCGFDGVAAGAGVGLMVALPEWVWLGLYFNGFCGAGIDVDEIVGKKKKGKKIIIVFIIF
jgi:hypothetical protein